jgi:hypothetical protein
MINDERVTFLSVPGYWVSRTLGTDLHLNVSDVVRALFLLGFVYWSFDVAVVDGRKKTVLLMKNKDHLEIFFALNQSFYPHHLVEVDQRNWSENDGRVFSSLVYIPL